MDEVQPRSARTSGALLVRVGASVVALGVGVALLYFSWTFIFRDYMDSPFYIYALFSAPAWILGLLLVAIGWRTLQGDLKSNRDGRGQHGSGR